MKKLNNVLLISGSGRNCGKTTVACHAIQQLAKSGYVYGLKITPHFHLTANNQQLVAKGLGYRIFRETDTQSGKDSSRMLKAGATAIFFIQCTDKYIPDVYELLRKLIPENKPIVCESGSLASVYRPGMHILIRGNEVDTSKKSFQENLAKANVILTQQDFSPSSLQHKITFSDQNWAISMLSPDRIRRIA